MSSKIKIAIVDDHGLMRQGIASLLSDVEDLEVVGVVGGGEEAINLTATITPDIFLMDVIMRGMSGIEAAKWIRDANPSIKVIIVSREINREFISNGIKAGISGYLLKDVDKDTLLLAIRTVMAGEHYFGREALSHLIQDVGKPSDKQARPKASLTKRENEILKLIAQGIRTKEIASRLFISVKTVEAHKLNIQSKLDLYNTAQLVIYAIENQIIEIKNLNRYTL